MNEPSGYLLKCMKIAPALFSSAGAKVKKCVSPRDAHVPCAA